MICTATRRRARRVSGTLAAIVAAAALALTGCSSGSSNPSGSGPTLSLPGGFGPQPKNFNPLVPTSGSVSMGWSGLIYEPLMQWNLTKASQVYPWLATSGHWSNGNRTLTMNLRKGVTWSDGKSFSSADVVFTFDLLKKYPALNTGGITFSSIAAHGRDQIVMNFASPSYTEYYQIAGSQVIVPKHIWAGLKDPQKFVNAHPVGTGPYELQRFDPQHAYLKKNPHYWQHGKPAVGNVEYDAYSSNSTALTALQQGKNQWSSNYVPNVQSQYVAKDPTNNHNWDFPGAPVSLFVNLTVHPLDQLPVRKAMSLAIDRKAISVQGETGQAQTVNDLTGLAPIYRKYLSPQYQHSSVTQNTQKAIQTLQDAGYTRGNDGIFRDPNGKPLKFVIICPTAFTDYMTASQIIARNLKQVGISATVQGESTQAWSDAFAKGRYQMSLYWGNGSPSPYYLYRDWLDSSRTQAIGTYAPANQERWKDPKSDALLKQYETATTEAGRTQALQGLEGIVAAKLPVIPLFYGPQWCEYSSKEFTGWPTKANSYELVRPIAPTAEVVMIRLHPKS